MLVKNYNAQKKLWKNTIEKYRCSRNAESELLVNESMFNREARNLERYFWKQQVLYIQDLEQRAQMIAFRTLRDFN